MLLTFPMPPAYWLFKCVELRHLIMHKTTKGCLMHYYAIVLSQSHIALPPDHSFRLPQTCLSTGIFPTALDVLMENMWALNVLQIQGHETWITRSRSAQSSWQHAMPIIGMVHSWQNKTFVKLLVNGAFFLWIMKTVYYIHWKRVLLYALKEKRTVQWCKLHDELRSIA